MVGDARPSSSTTSQTHQLLLVLVLMLVGAFISVLLALGLSWATDGAIIQITANALTGRWGGRAEKAARFLLDRNAVHVIASDAHGTGSRPPVLSEARKFLEKAYGAEVAHAVVDDNPAAIVAGQPLPH